MLQNKTSTDPISADRSLEENIAFATIYTVLGALVIGLNSLIIHAYRQNRKLQTATHMLFVYLAASDLLVGIVSIPLWTLHEYIGAFEITNVFQKVFRFFDIFTALASIIFLAAISVERNLAISKPIYHRVFPQSLRYYHVTGFVIWFYVLALAVTVVQDIDQIWRKWRGLVSFLLGFFLPLCLIITMYINMWKNVKKFESRRRSLASHRNLRALQRERRAAWTVAIVIGLFVVAWLPFFIFSLLYVLCGTRCVPAALRSRYAVDVVKILHYSNSAVNPFVYGYRNADVRRTIWGILTRRRRRKAGIRVRRVPKPQTFVNKPNLAEQNGMLINVVETPL